MQQHHIAVQLQVIAGCAPALCSRLVCSGILLGRVFFLLGFSSAGGVRPAAHISLSALKSAATKTITVSSNNTNYGTVSGGGTYAINSSINIYATPKTGYQLKGWSTNGGSTIISGSEGKTTYAITVTANATYTAVFEPLMYTVTTSVFPAGAGTVSGGGSYAYNTSATITVNANNPNYKFIGWDTNGDNVADTSATNEYTFTVTGNALVTAVFELLAKVTLQVNDENYGKILYNNSLITSTEVIQDSGTQIANIYAIASSYYAFLYWLDTATGQRYTANPLTYTVSTNTTLTAIFGSSIAGGVAVVAENGGEVRMSGYDDDATVIHVSAVAYTGYYFVGWYVMGEESPISTALTVDLALAEVQNKIVIARFAPITNQNDMNTTTDNGYNEDFV